MLATALWTLRQRRYAYLAALMVVVAAICVVAGTWQISRFNQSVRDNNALSANAHAATIALTTAIVPLVGQGSRPSADVIRFRTVTATGSYLDAKPQFVGNETVNGVDGYYILSPLRTGEGVLLVARGFAAAATDGAPPSSVPAPPAGTVAITGRLQTASTTNDGASTLIDNQLVAINPAQQSARLASPVYDAYLSLDSGQPGTSGVTVLPDPDLSNPAGGAYEWQHFAYIIQWYLFALLALAAPFLIARHEIYEARRLYLGIDPANEEFGLDAADPAALTAGAGGGGGTVALRSANGLARRGQPTPEQWRRAARLADRYGRSLGVTDVGPVEEELPPRPAHTDARVDETFRVPNTAVAPARSADDFHGSYNDYLWQLSLADGDVPDVSPSAVIDETDVDPPGAHDADRR